MKMGNDRSLSQNLRSASQNDSSRLIIQRGGLRLVRVPKHSPRCTTITRREHETDMRDLMWLNHDWPVTGLLPRWDLLSKLSLVDAGPITVCGPGGQISCGLLSISSATLYCLISLLQFVFSWVREYLTVWKRWERELFRTESVSNCLSMVARFYRPMGWNYNGLVAISWVTCVAYQRHS